VKKRASIAAVVAAAVPVPALAKKHRHYPPGCQTKKCANRIGAIWRDHHPKAHASSLVAPYRAWLNRVARCESSNNTRAISADGLYRGLFQFDLQTWHSVGGVGDPIDASRAEQELRAVLLLKRRGTSPWPVCG
jgi:hypothetical protein